MKNWRILLILTSVIGGAMIYFFQVSASKTQSYEGTELSGEAADFQLTDHNG